MTLRVSAPIRYRRQHLVQKFAIDELPMNWLLMKTMIGLGCWKS
jgi:hypothetical protein